MFVCENVCVIYLQIETETDSMNKMWGWKKSRLWKVDHILSDRLKKTIENSIWWIKIQVPDKNALSSSVTGMNKSLSVVRCLSLVLHIISFL